MKVSHPFLATPATEVKLESLCAARNRPPFNRPVAVLCAAGIVWIAATGFAWAQTGLPAPQTAGDVEYVTGGFGQDMSDAFKRAQSEYPLALSFAEDAGEGSRPYVADVELTIKDESGVPVLELPSVGPYFLARLKPGQYTVEASYRGQSKTQKIAVKEGASAPEVMTWKTR